MDAKLDFTITVPKDFILPASISNVQANPTEFLTLDPTVLIPSRLPSNIYAAKNGLVEGDWKNFLMRCFIPNYASQQDEKVSKFFIDYFKKIFADNTLPVDKGKLNGMLSLSEQHITRGQGWFSKSNSAINSRLEHYVLAARNRFNQFDASHEKESLTKKCCSDNKSLLARWNKLGFPVEAFLDYPDFVDWIFKTHLHRHIAHPAYKHTISMQTSLAQRGGQITVIKEPHLLMNGRLAPWSAICQRIKLDKDNRLYSKENGQKTYWTYLDEGLTQWDRHHFENPRRIWKLDQVPPRSRVEVITTHAPKKKWHLGDRLLQGTRHSFFRLAVGEGFSARHPEAGLADGDVYSFGWGARWHDFSLSHPLATMVGKWFCPDSFEFFNEDLCITPQDATDEQILTLLNVVKKRSQEEYPFHVITGNCCGITADVLNEAGILNLCTKNHMLYMWYKFFLPKNIRHPINKTAHFIRRFMPDCIVKKSETLGKFLYSVAFAPIFSLLGAWRTNITYEDEEGDIAQQDAIRAKASNRIKALFSSFFDMFDPKNMEFKLTMNIYKWQKKQPGTTRENRN